MEPRDPASVADRKANFVYPFAAVQPLGDALAQGIEPLASERRERHDVLSPACFLEQSPAVVGREQIDLVPCFKPRRRPLFRQAERGEHILDVLALRFAIGVRHVANVDQEVGGGDFLKGRAEGRD
jgi:hypothetical protein